LVALGVADPFSIPSSLTISAEVVGADLNFKALVFNVDEDLYGTFIPA